MIDRSLLVALALVGGLVLLGAVGLQRDRIRTWLAPDPVALPVPTSPIGLDLARVHQELLPQLILAGAHPEAPDAITVGDTARRALRDELARDPGLAAIFEDLVAHAADPVARSEALFVDVDRWNRRLVALGEPWRLEGAVQLGEPPFFYVKCYRVLRDADVRVADHTVRVRLVQRVDQLNVVERYLGAARNDQGAVVVVDRVVDFTLDHLWPLLADDPHRPSGQAAWRDAILAELARELPADDLARLQVSAPHRARLLAVVEHIAERRACGATLGVARPPWSGFEPDDVQALWGYAAASSGRSCPDLMDAEALAIDESSTALRTAIDGLGPSLERLAALAARAFATHEARHVADALAYGEAANVACLGCESILTPEARAELSAYAAAIAADGTSVTAAWQACSAVDGGGAHGAAIIVIAAAIGSDLCAQGPGIDLAARARRFEQETFGRDERVALPEDWPERVPID